MSSFKSNWINFWFNTENIQAKTIAFFRMLVGGLLFVFYLLRFLNFETYYGEEGFLPISKLGIYDLGFNYYILDYVQMIQSELFFYLLHIGFLVLLAALTIGVLPRWTTAVTFLIHVLFLHRNPLINYGVDFYATSFLFYLCFIQHSIFFSVKCSKKPLDLVSSVGFRLLQIQFVVAYAYAGFEKLKGQTWWEGKAVWNTLINTQIASFDFSWMSHFPFIIAVLSFLTIIYEIYAPVAFFNDKSRRLWLFLGLGFHLGIFVTMNIPFFGLIMAIGLLIFVKDEELNALLKFYRVHILRRQH